MTPTSRRGSLSSESVSLGVWVFFGRSIDHRGLLGTSDSLIERIRTGCSSTPSPVRRSWPRSTCAAKGTRCSAPSCGCRNSAAASEPGWRSRSSPATSSWGRPSRSPGCRCASTVGVASLARFGGQMAEVPAELVEALRSAAEEPRTARPMFQQGQKVRIVTGDFATLESVFDLAEGRSGRPC
jgi:hypothetical protein